MASQNLSAATRDRNTIGDIQQAIFICTTADPAALSYKASVADIITEARALGLNLDGGGPTSITATSPNFDFGGP